MRAIQVAVVNASSLQDDDVADGMRALQKQVREDFGPVWHVDAQLHLVTSREASVPARCKHRSGTESCPDHWGLILLDDEPGDPRLRGYHDLTAHGLPLARVLVQRLARDRDWSHTASHELLEMLADPDGNAAAYHHPDASTIRIYAQEVCDPCGAYTDGYDIGGRRVSDFVWPSWFQAQSPRRGVTKFDERGLVERPFQLRPDGYIGVFDPETLAWKVMGFGAELEAGMEGDERLERRTAADSRWQLSDMSLSP